MSQVPAPRRRTGAYVAIAAIVAAVGGAFAWTAGWLTPDRLTSARMTDAIEATSTTPYPGFRRAHAKGICVVGHFEGNPEGAALSSASVFSRTDTPVLGRLSIGGGSPYGLDAQARVRSMSLVLKGADGSEWRMAMNSFPFFGAASIETFLEQTRASAPDPATGKPDPERMAAFAAQHSEAQRFAAWAKSAPWSDSFANTQYNGIHAYRFTGKGGERLVRWSMRPQAPFVEMTAAQREAAEGNYLQDELRERLANGPLRWDMVATIAADGDDASDPSTPWPDDREQVVVGTVVVTDAQDQATGACRDLNFDPTIIPTGVALSDDPILAARAAVYAQSFDRREREVARGADVDGTPPPEAAR
ncbi:catalase family peroxidase [Luteimonas fraxinea]|uniref:Catalase-related peroxidase n=1 Tax=Luteimonas fraxinea TaxID=2901869 RepID=A0ABS8UFH9_9GAMM|nr:catalase family peroxidase [Luteimonas fraxinea]MCD9097496.1 catalase family peroxidase [Luteimonas fraxinea]MCD9124947.1 catalase family peroxidase [Luteimonas fraxinea]UHH11747.1 catalase family peroxidase [Luteimonas fraxinea]